MNYSIKTSGLRVST